MDVELVEPSAISPIQLEAWWQLFDFAPEARFYQHPHWNQCIAEHLSPEKLKLGFLTIGDQLQMVLPLCSSTGERHRTHPTHDHLSLADVLIHPSLANDAEQLFKAIRLTLNKPGTGWWDWKVSNLAHHSALVQTLSKALCLTPANHAASNRIETDQENTTDNWLLKQTRESASFNCAAAERAPTGKLRRNLRRLRKQMRDFGELRVDVIVNPEKLSDAYEYFLAVEASGWKGKGNQAPAISANPELQAFYQSNLKSICCGVTMFV